jgi:hypothetical protein
MKKYIISGTLIIFIMACQPRPMTRVTTQAPVDSALFFEHQDVSDEFIARTDGSMDKPILLKIDRYPLPETEPPPPQFKEAEGFRVQAFAGLDSANVSEIANSLQKIILSDSVYFFHENGLFKIQVGDFLYRPQAEAMRTRLQDNGHTGAWVIKRQILIPVIADSTAGNYKIQIGATSSRENAENLIEKARPLTSSELFFEKVGDLYKVFIGYFTSEAEARDVLGKIRQAGFPDAWLVY